MSTDNVISYKKTINGSATATMGRNGYTPICGVMPIILQKYSRKNKE